MTAITAWLAQEFGHTMWAKLRVTVLTEQTCLRYKGSSHPAQQASADLSQAKLTGDSGSAANAIRRRNWAAEMVELAKIKSR